MIWRQRQPPARSIGCLLHEADIDAASLSQHRASAVMIVFDVACDQHHRFEGWFADAAAFESQRDSGLIACPYCESTTVERALSVPRIGGARGAAISDVEKLAKLQATMLKDSTWVGTGFAAKARAMADGSEPQATIHGQTTLGEAKALHDDGIAVLPLPFPVVPPQTQN